MRRVAVRKILRARRMVRTLDVVVAVSAALAVLGIALYLIVYPSEVVLMEAFVWLSEAISFLGLMMAFHFAASRVAMMYRARYEILRLESLASLLVSILAVFMTSLVVYKTATSWHAEPTPIMLSLYPLASSAISYVLERRIHRIFHRVEVHLVSLHTVARKLGLDVVFEAAGGLAIIASNMLHNVLAEKLVVFATAAYVYYGLAGIAYESVMYLLGMGPEGVVEKTRRDVERIVKKSYGRRPSRLRIETLGTFAEVVVWLEGPPHMSLESAHRISIGLAREIVHRVPQVIRALVIMVPWAKPVQGLREPVVRGYIASRGRRPRLVPYNVAPRRRRHQPSTARGLPRTPPARQTPAGGEQSRRVGEPASTEASGEEEK